MFYPDQFISCSNCPNSVVPYIVEKGGYLLDNSTSSCSFCGTANSNSFLADMNLSFEIRWRNFGVGVLCLQEEASGVDAILTSFRLPLLEYIMR